MTVETNIETLDELEETLSFRKDVTGISPTLFISPHTIRIGIDPPDRVDPRGNIATVTLDGAVIREIDPQLARFPAAPGGSSSLGVGVVPDYALLEQDGRPRMVVDIQPVVVEGEHYVTVIMDGCEMRRHRPYSDRGTAEAAANHMIGVCAVLGAVNTGQPQAARKHDERR